MTSGMSDLIEGLIEAQVVLIMAERVVDQLGDTDASALDVVLEGRTTARQRFSQKAGAFLGAIRILAEERVARNEAREG
jgi:hypothetical protein